MRPIQIVFLALVVLVLLLIDLSNAQTAQRPKRLPSFTCSPAPCVLPPTQVSEGGALVNTPTIAADPVSPEQMVLGANDDNCPFSTGWQAAYASRDGGATWSSPFCLPQIDLNGVSYAPAIDPNVAYDRNGVAYIAGPFYHTQGSDETGFVAFSKSTDGVNWSQPAVALRVSSSFASDSWLAIDNNPSSPYLNSLYLSAVIISPPGLNTKNQVFVAHSADGGQTWSISPVDSAQRTPASDQLTTMTVGADGTAYLSWLHCAGSGQSAGCNNGQGYIVFSKSSDGGNTWSSPGVIAEPKLPTPWVLPNTGVRVYNYAALGVDNSGGPRNGALYASMFTWTGTYLRVGVIHSTDGGTIWSKPVPVAPLSANHDQFFPWLSVSPTGLVGVSWLDRRNDPANINYQAFAAISSDGGQSFQPNIQLTTKFSNPNNNGYPDNGWMGDYTGNTWAGPNYFVAAWMDSSNGVDMQDVVGGIRLH